MRFTKKNAPGLSQGVLLAFPSRLWTISLRALWAQSQLLQHVLYVIIYRYCNFTLQTVCVCIIEFIICEFWEFLVRLFKWCQHSIESLTPAAQAPVTYVSCDCCCCCVWIFCIQLFICHHQTTRTKAIEVGVICQEFIYQTVCCTGLL